MRYLPHTDEEIREMLESIGIQDLEDLFSTIHEDCRYEGPIDLPEMLDEWQLLERMQELGAANRVSNRFSVLIGAGSYHHNIPETVRSLTGRGEFLTAYTPYQPEMAQGTLQGIYEYQTLTARLLGMDVVNASMYDGASALAEALLMALRIKKGKTKVALSSAIHPHYRQVVRTYLEPAGFAIVELPYDRSGRTDLGPLAEAGDIAAVAIQSPNFFGVIEDLDHVAGEIHGRQGLFVAAFTEPIAFGLLKNPGSCGADIVCGEGQSLGMSRSFGGAGLGMFGCRNEFMRNMPGRLEIGRAHV
jgi:glycine dehydrogenase subunit 1